MSAPTRELPRMLAHYRETIAPALQSEFGYSNVMVVCPVCNRPTRVGIRDKDSNGQPVKVRVCKRADCGEDIDR